MTQGKEAGYLTYDEINDSLSSEQLDPDQIDDMLQLFADEGIEIIVRNNKSPYPLPLAVSESPAAAFSSPGDNPDEELAAMEGLPVDDAVRSWLREIGRVP